MGLLPAQPPASASRACVQTGMFLRLASLINVSGINQHENLEKRGLDTKQESGGKQDVRVGWTPGAGVFRREGPLV